jgi:hypothetical protein
MINAQVQYALRIENPTDNICCRCHKSFWDFKEKIRSKGLHDYIFGKVTMGLAKIHNVNTTHVRIDSVNIKSNMKNLSRATLFHKTLISFLSRLKKRSPDLFDTIDSLLTSKYFKKKTGYDYFGGVKPTERAALLKSMAVDIWELIKMFDNNDRVLEMQSFRSLKRLFSEQCKVIPPTEGNSEEKVELKPPKEVPADSLQNPSDPDAGYDAHKPTGRYQAQIVETFDPADSNEDAEGDHKKSLSLILHVNTESAAKHDSHAVKPAIDDMLAKGLEIKAMLGDTLYGGDENVEYASSHGISLVSPVPGNTKVDSTSAKATVANENDTNGQVDSPEPGNQAEEMVNSSAKTTLDGDLETESASGDEPSKRLSLADFEKDEKGRIISCPMGEKASTCKNKAGTGYCSTFNLEKCKACPMQGQCPVRVGKRKASIHYTEKDIRIAGRRREHETPEFKKLYRKRSGIEATNSVLARKYHIKNLRVRGKKAIGLTVTCKALALNITRTAAFNRVNV